MIIIRENVDSHNETYYEKALVDSETGKEINKNLIKIRLFRSRSTDGRDAIMLYDSAMKPILNANRFLNFGMDYQSDNYVRMSVVALKLLYAYCAAFDVDFEYMNIDEARTLMTFLKGTSLEGRIYVTDLTTMRTNATINAYLKVYRRYARYLGYDSHILLLKSSTVLTMVEYGKAANVEKYKVTKKMASDNDVYVPPFISIPQYKRCLECARNYDDPLRDTVIMQLMFCSGLRIGECLGLTIEDIKTVHREDGPAYYLELRNRVSDKPWQKAKGALNVTSDRDYNDPDYRKSGVGYQSICISPYVASNLLEYVEEAHNVRDKQYNLRRKESALADTVHRAKSRTKQNYYIFLNRLGRRLTNDAWNKRLRNIFADAGIDTDAGVRKNGLSHRFRHGFAMMLTHDIDGISPTEVKALMRHRSLKSTEVYLSMTPERNEEIRDQLVGQIEKELIKEDE